MNIHQVLKDRSLILFLILLAVFIGNALVAEFVGLKIFSLEKLMGIAPFSMTFFGVDGLGFNLTAGVVLWPVVFVMTDIINEYYGPDWFGLFPISQFLLFPLHLFLCGSPFCFLPMTGGNMKVECSDLVKASRT